MAAAPGFFRGEAAGVDGERATGHEGGHVAGGEHDHAGHVVGHAHPTERVVGCPRRNVDPGVEQRRHLLPNARCVRDGRRHAEHADPERAELDAERLGDPDNGVFRGDIDADACAPPEPRGGGEVDHDAAVGHTFRRFTGAEVAPPGVDRQHSVDEVDLDVGCGACGMRDPGVVDPDVEPAELLDRSVGGCGDARRIGDVEVDTGDATSGARRHLLGECCHTVGISTASCRRRRRTCCP